MAQLFSQAGAKACFFFICPQTVMNNSSGSGLFCLLIGSAVELVAFVSFFLCLNTACQMCKDSFAL